MKKVDKVIQQVESQLSIKQKNGSIRSVQDEAMFLCGAMVVIHALINNNSDRLDNIPPKWIFLPMSSRSINDFNYKGDE